MADNAHLLTPNATTGGQVAVNVPYVGIQHGTLDYGGKSVTVGNRSYTLYD
jgi:hypothetical protein